MYRKKKVSENIGEFLIGEMISGGLALILIIYGINYFALKFAWTKLISMLVQESGVDASSLGTELSLIGNNSQISQHC